MKKRNKIKLNNQPAYEKICELFSELVIESNHYLKEREGRKRETVVNGIKQGKLAEIMIWKYLRSKKRDISTPDFMLYDESEKSFDADLMQGGIKIHIKSCQYHSRFSPSWTFQINDPLVNDPDSLDMLALVVMGEEPYCYFIPADEIEFEEPRKVEYVGKKKCVYESSFASEELKLGAS